MSQPGAVVELRTAAAIGGLEETYQELLSNSKLSFFRHITCCFALAVTMHKYSA